MYSTALGYVIHSNLFKKKKKKKKKKNLLKAYFTPLFS